MKVVGRDRGSQIELIRRTKMAKRTLAMRLTANDWVLYRTRDPAEKLWLGRAVPRTEWDQKVLALLPLATAPHTTFLFIPSDTVASVPSPLNQLLPPAPINQFALPPSSKKS